jgi:CheY-like chemotaxis protein
MDPAQIEQIILNLAVNARDAMPTGGRLTIQTANVVLNDGYVAQHLDAQPGEHVLLIVSDTGMGMSDEVKSHLFEPFFTTKEVGKGTGLGLAAVHGIVNQNSGHISVYSEAGRGTTFTIYLPRANEPPLPARSAETLTFGHNSYRVTLPPAGPAETVASPIGDETILLVEDDEHVRELARRVLENHGYTLLEAQDGHEALHLASGYSGPIHLLLTDVVMPGMSGEDLARELTHERTDLKILFMSGYTEEMIVHHGELAPGAEFLQKPFSPSDLVRRVRDMLDR